MLNLIKYSFSVLLVLLAASCINRTPEDFLKTAKQQLCYLMYDQGLGDSDIDKMKLLKVYEDSLNYCYLWYHITETNDSIRVHISIRKEWPYSSPINSFTGSMAILNKDRMSLKNLFDTSVVNNSNLDKFIELGRNDTIDWIVNKNKIVDHIKRGHYNLLENRKKPYYLGLFIDIGKSKVGKYRTWEVKIDFLEKNKILITPAMLPDTAYCNSDSLLLESIYKYRVK